MRRGHLREPRERPFRDRIRRVDGGVVCGFNKVFRLRRERQSSCSEEAAFGVVQRTDARLYSSRIA